LESDSSDAYRATLKPFFAQSIQLINVWPLLRV